MPEYLSKNSISLKRNSKVYGDKKSNVVYAKWLYQIQNKICPYCKNSLELTRRELDHIRPICLGGSQEDINNMQLLCIQCHQNKTTLDKEIMRILEILGIKQGTGWSGSISMCQDDCDKLVNYLQELRLKATIDTYYGAEIWKRLLQPYRDQILSKKNINKYEGGTENG